jgi:hypothetical protein
MSHRAPVAGERAVLSWVPARHPSSSLLFSCHRARSRRAQRAPRAWMPPRTSRTHLGSRRAHGPRGRSRSNRHDRESRLSITSRYITVVGSRTGNVRPETSKGHPVSLGWPFCTETLVTSSG